MTTIDSNIHVHSPSYARQTIEGDTTVRELPWCGKINLRAKSDETLANAVNQALNMTLPLELNRKQVSGDTSIYRLGPDEWLIYCDPKQVATLMQSLSNALQDTHHSLVEVTDYYSVLELSGPDAEHVIRAACPLDIHASVFPVESVAQTRFGHSSILLDKVDTTTFHIQIRWSHTEYLWDYFHNVLALRG